MTYKRTLALLNRNRIMATGHIDEIAAPKREVQATLVKHPDLQAYLDTTPTISREYLVPYLGGISQDGRVVYIDKGLPDRLPKTGIDPDKYIALHERSEWWLMMRLRMDYLGKDGGQGAHHYAVRIEHDALHFDGHNPDEYEHELVPYIRRDERARISPDTVPPDLFLGPYEDEEDSVDYDILPVLRAAAVPLSGRRLSHAMVEYGPGHSPEYCRTCKYSDHAPQPTCRYVANIAPDGWCELWQKA
jgi:hypothetical protein